MQIKINRAARSCRIIDEDRPSSLLYILYKVIQDYDFQYDLPPWEGLKQSL